VIASRTVLNQGLRDGMMRYAVVRDCRTEEERAITDNELSFCRPVGRQTRAVANGPWPRRVACQRAQRVQGAEA
jgi:hypothetical protein